MEVCNLFVSRQYQNRTVGFLLVVWDVIVKHTLNTNRLTLFNNHNPSYRFSKLNLPNIIATVLYTNKVTKNILNNYVTCVTSFLSITYKGVKQKIECIFVADIMFKVIFRLNSASYTSIYINFILGSEKFENFNDSQIDKSRKNVL